MNDFLTVSKRDKVLLVILVVLAAGFLYFKLLILPSTKDISNVSVDIESNKQKLEDLQYKKTQNTILKNNISKLQGKYDEAKKAVTIDAKDADITDSLYSLSVKNNVKITAITYSQGVEYSNNTVNNTNAASTNQNTKDQGGKLMRMDASLAVTGNLTDIIKFMDNLQNSERIDIINNVSINKDTSADKATINTSYFYFTAKAQQQNSQGSNSDK